MPQLPLTEHAAIAPRLRPAKLFGIGSEPIVPDGRCSHFERFRPGAELQLPRRSARGGGGLHKKPMKAGVSSATILTMAAFPEDRWSAGRSRNFSSGSGIGASISGRL